MTNPLVIQTTGIAHPRAVDAVVVARRVALNFFFARTDDCVAAGAAARAKALGFLEEPDAHLETKIFRCQRADRADIHRVERVIVVERFAGIMRERAVTAAVDEAERVVAGDVAREPDAARAQDATFRIEHDARPEVNGLRLVNLRLDEAARALAIVHGVFLQFTFAGLVADRAIERMIDEQKLKHALAHLFHSGRRRVNFHSRRNRRRAGNGRTRRFCDLRRAVRIQHRLAIRAERRRAELDEAHAAVAGDGQLRMPAIMRHVHFGQLARLNHRRGRELARPVGREARHFDFAPVHLHLDFYNRGRRGLRFSCGGG